MPREGLVELRPQPVVTAAKVAAAVGGVAAGLGTVAVALGFATQEDVDALTTALISLAGAVVTLITVAAPILQALKARDLVTPLSDPRDASGVALVPVVDPESVVLDLGVPEDPSHPAG